MTPTNDSTLEQWIHLTSSTIVSMLIGILITFWMIYHYQKQSNQSSTELSEQEGPSNQTDITRNIDDLPNFKAIKPYTIFLIHRTQSHFILDELLIEAKRTRIFTIVPKIQLSYYDYMVIHLELVQDTQTIIALIEYFPETDINSDYFQTLRQLFMTIFDSAKTIQTWGNIIQQLKSYTRYGLFSLNEVSQGHSIDIQKQFKSWYNDTFHHNKQCHRHLKYDTMDGSLCLCSHRPYKSAASQWSISRALTYTFDEQFNYHIHGTHRCLAITKLAHVINEKWTIKHLTDYKQQYHINLEVTMDFF